MKKVFSVLILVSMLIASCALVGCKEKLPTLPPVVSSETQAESSVPEKTTPSVKTPTAEPSTKTPAVEPSTETPTGEPSTETPAGEPSTETPTVEPSTETPTEEPSTETPAVEPSPETPTEEPSTETPVTPVDPNGLSGTFLSDTGTALELQLDYKIEKQQDGNYLVTATVYLNCYSLRCAERANCNTVTIGDTDYVYSTEKLALETGSEKNHVKLTAASRTFAENELPDSLNLGATWVFRGSYSKVPIDTLEASGTVKLR